MDELEERTAVVHTNLALALSCLCWLQLRDLEARLLQEREEKSVLAGMQQYGGRYAAAGPLPS